MTDPSSEAEVETSDAIQPLDLILDPAVSADPQPIYRRLRQECPVSRQENGMFGSGGTLLLYRHVDIEHALRHPDQFSSNFGTGAEGLGNDRPMIPLQIDPPDHKKYRVLLDPLFAPKKMAALDADIVELVNDLIDTFVERGECELNHEFAVPLPCIVFLRLLGLPLEDLDLFLRLKDGIIRGGGEADFDKQGEVRAAAGREFYDYFNAVIEDRRRQPRDDMVSRFLEAKVDGNRLTHEEILDIGYLFVIAGLDTVTDSLTCFFHTLANRADLRRRLADDPEIIPAAVEELLRWETPVPSVARVLTRDTVIGGCPARAGDSVLVSIGSANTDEAAFERANEIDFDRTENRHLAFGGGIHRCLGSHLARRELRLALREWHRRIPDYHIAVGAELQWAPMLRQVEHLPLVFDEIRG